MKADRRAQSARPRGMSLANSVREAKGGACPPFLRSYNSNLAAPPIGIFGKTLIRLAFSNILGGLRNE